ncbi:phytanoyl-CoA dioxygenase family protein [Streptosporangium sp. NPDC004631]
MHDGPEFELSEVCDQIADIGYAVLTRALSPELLQQVRVEYSKLYDELRRVDEAQPLESSHSGKNHYQIQPPIRGVFSNPDVFASRIVLDCVRSMLGSDARLAYYNSNICEPGSDFQEIHRDVRLLFGSEISLPTPPFMLAVNILLCDFTVENGSTEIWPGSHLLPDREGGGHAADLEARSMRMTSCRLNAPAGSIIIRDARLWHRGTPNKTQEHRAMLSLVYKRKWFGYRHDRSLEVSDETYHGWPGEIRSLFLR